MTKDSIFINSYLKGSWKYARDACAGAKLQMIALASYAERDYINNALGTSTSMLINDLI